MADSESWAALRRYVAQRDEAKREAAELADTLSEGVQQGAISQEEADDLAEHPDQLPAEPPRRRFHPGAIGPLLDSALPQGLVERAARIPTPGGLFAILAALIFFLFAIVPVGVSGQTRLQLIWQALTGAVALGSAEDVAAQQVSNLATAVTNAVVTPSGLPTLPNATRIAAQAAIAESQGANPLWQSIQAVGQELLPSNWVPDAIGAIKQL